MTVKHIRRIQFYTRKAAAACRHGSHPVNQLRISRLRAYRAALAKRLMAVGYRWRPKFEL